jgi:hypothetical protein
MGDAEKRPGAALTRVLQALDPPQGWELKSYVPFMPRPIHLCSQWLHLWVTASLGDLVYRLHIRKYFGTKIWPSAEAASCNSFLGKGPGSIGAFVSGARLSESTSVRCSVVTPMTRTTPYDFREN